jgi:formylglycine-generating enzyme required for sulfatase activity
LAVLAAWASGGCLKFAPEPAWLGNAPAESISDPEDSALESNEIRDSAAPLRGADPEPKEILVPADVPTPLPDATDAGAEAESTTPDAAQVAVAPVLILAGPFSMGSPEGEGGKAGDEPAHQVELSAYRIWPSEVSNASYLECVEAGACTSPTTCASGIPEWSGAQSFPAEKAQHPVRCTTWEMARTYCAWAGARLCTEAEWERGCVTAESHRVYPWGDAWPLKPELYANCDEGWCHDGFAGTAASGGFLGGATPDTGIVDLAGNVSEWVLDYYDAKAYDTSPPQNPKGPCDGQAPCDGLFVRVHRGGNYKSESAWLRCSARGQPAETSAEPFIGVRCCDDL